MGSEPLYMWFEGLPPSTNHAYYEQIVKARGGKGRLVPVRTLTKEGKAYKLEVTSRIAREYGPLLGRHIEQNQAYGVAIQVYLPTLVNKSYPKSAKNRYRKLDADNRLKLFLDALSDGLGIDDCNFLQVGITKCQGPEKTEVWVWKMENQSVNQR